MQAAVHFGAEHTYTGIFRRHVAIGNHTRGFRLYSMMIVL